MTSLSNVCSMFNKKAYFFPNHQRNWLQSLDLVRIKIVDIQNGKRSESMAVPIIDISVTSILSLIMTKLQNFTKAEKIVIF